MLLMLCDPLGHYLVTEDNVIIRPAINTLIINSYGLTISTKIILILLEIKELMVTLFIILVKRVKKY